MTQDEAKLAVAKRAVEFVKDGMRVGLGTGSTATMFIKELGAKVKAGMKIRTVASSDASHDLAASLGIDVMGLDELPELDIYIDGSDEVSVQPGGLALIKGGGGGAAAGEDCGERGQGVSGRGGFQQDCEAPGQVSAAG